MTTPLSPSDTRVEPTVGPAFLRLPKAIVDAARRDLRRPHAHAAERVGFLSVAMAAVEGGEVLLIAAEYRGVPDGQYVPGRGAGARIGTTAIRDVVGWALGGGFGIFHVHLHDHDGIPGFSRTDRREQPRLVASLRAAGPGQAHGMIVLSADAANAWVWLPGTGEPMVPARLSVVGDPMVLLTGDMLRDDERDDGEAGAAGGAEPTAKSGDRYSRQSFLGGDSQRRLATARVGILGYGGGGSHVGQQLAHLGVGNVYVADGDRIDESNLNRLVGGTAADVRVAQRKVDIARRMITGVMEDADVRVHEGRWQERATFFRECDVVVGCVDSFAERREIEVMARRFAIPYVDIGMDVHQVPGDAPRVGGQMLLSLPDGPCMTCLGFLTEARLAEEAALYGAAGRRPQVVWPNGILASSAVGVVVSLLTGWTGETDRVVYLSYDGNRGTLAPHPRLAYLGRAPCPHYAADAVGEPRFRPVGGA
jgi:hypothetical protein